MTPRMDQQAQFEAFYRNTAAGIMRQVLTLTRDHAEAQDCVQEAFARAWQHWSSVSSHPDPQAWVRRVAYRCAISRWRKTRNRLLAHWREAADRPLVVGIDPQVVALIEAMRTLSDAHREVLALHYLTDLSIAEVAQTLEIPENTVKSRLLRARQQLAAALADDLTDDGPPPPTGGKGHIPPVTSAKTTDLYTHFTTALRLVCIPLLAKEALR